MMSTECDFLRKSPNETMELEYWKLYSGPRLMQRRLLQRRLLQIVDVA